jgi:hypothetical protein
MFFLTKFKTCFKQKKLFKIKKTVCFVLNKKKMFFANPEQHATKLYLQHTLTTWSWSQKRNKKTTNVWIKKTPDSSRDTKYLLGTVM